MRYLGGPGTGRKSIFRCVAPCMRNRCFDNKAFTSRAFDISTKKLAANSQSGGPFFGVHVSNQGRIMIFAGGIPLKRGGKVVGAIGVSGGSGEQDQAVAEAGAAAFV
jgi:uncharacterized protein GlcG (DUF336 family)